MAALPNSKADEVEEDHIYLPFDLLANLLFLTAEAARHLDDALNGRPAELLRGLAVHLDHIESHFCSMGYVDTNDQLLGDADQYDLMGQAFDNHEFHSWSVELKGNHIRLIRRVKSESQDGRPSGKP